MSAKSNPKIFELTDDNGFLSDASTDLELDDDEVPIKFKQSVLKNKSLFGKQLLESTEIDPSEIFDVTSLQEVDGETKELYSKMDQKILEYFTGDADEENKLLKLATQMMTPLPGVDGVFKKLCHPGEGNFPPENSIVTIHYSGYIQDDISNQVKSFDCTFLRGKPKSFMRGLGLVIEGLDIAVGSMKLKEQSEFIISPDLAWGDKGCPPRIPADAYVYFKIDLIEWIDSSAAEAFSKLPLKMRKEVSFEKVLEASKSEKRKGTAHFSSRNYRMAMKCYRRALGWIEDLRFADETEEKLGMAHSLILHLDLALVFLKINKPKKTCIHCKEALTIDPDNPKALYRFGLAKERLGDFDSARHFLMKAKQILPKDSSIATALINLNEKVQKEKYIETELCRKMLGVSATTEKVPEALSEESHKIMRQMISEFVENIDDITLDFPPGMAQHERKFVEAEAKRLNLKFSLKPSGKGEAICSISKPKQS